jgi:hypothetical protein
MLITSRQLKTMPLAEIKRRLAFLRIPDRDLPEAVNRARYELQFEIGVLAISSLVAVAVAIGAMLAWFFVAQGASGGECPPSIISLWPPNAVLLRGLPSSLTNGWTQQLGSPLCTTEVCSSAVSLVWVVWLAFRIAADLLRPVSVLASKPFIWWAHIIIVGGFWIAALPMTDAYHRYSVSIGDPLWFAVPKRAFFISLAFWLLGVALFFDIAFIRRWLYVHLFAGASQLTASPQATKQGDEPDGRKPTSIPIEDIIPPGNRKL